MRVQCKRRNAQRPWRRGDAYTQEERERENYSLDVSSSGQKKNIYKNIPFGVRIRLAYV